MIILKKDILNNIFFCYTYFNKRRLIMKKSVVSEIYLTSKSVSKESWHALFLQLTDYLGSFSTFQIFVVCELNKIHYYIRTGEVIPTILGEMSDFMFREVDVNWSFVYEKGFVYMNHLSDTVVDIFDRESLKKNREVSILELDFRSISGQRLLSKGYLYIKEAGIVICRKLFKTIPEILLSIDFSKNKKYVCQSQPKYLDFQKSLSLFHSDSLQALLSVSMFPYFSKDYYLNLSSYSFDKHSFIVGASGSGKSKFISLFISRLAASLDYKLKYNRMTVKLFIFSDVNKQRELSKCTISMFQISAKCSTKTSSSNICPFSCYNCLEFKHIMSYNKLEKRINHGNARKLFYVISLSLKIREIPRLFTEQKILTYERKKKYVFSRSRADIFRKR